MKPIIQNYVIVWHGKTIKLANNQRGRKSDSAMCEKMARPREKK